MSQLRSDATQAIAEAIQDTMMRKWTPLDEAASAVLDALLDYLEAHAEEWADWDMVRCAKGSRHHSIDYCGCPTDDQVRGLVSALRVEP